MKLQQYSGPVMAKGLEDTAFYRYHRFLALNEVGGHPHLFGTTLAAFHRSNQIRAQRWPHAMLGTSTHDTKHGEDVRARLAVLSELPDEWARNVETWSRLLRARRGDIEGTAPPDRNDEYMLYQLLVGSWPPELLEEPSLEAITAYAERVGITQTKSLREARRQSSWAAPDAAYEQAMLDFAALALDPTRASAFLASFLPFTERIARLGAQNTLVQTVLKLTLPGVPDIYQGSELWDLSLVDPDNRRPVDYAERKARLSSCCPIPAFMQHWQDGGFKLETIRRLLEYRQSHPALFASGDYEPVHAEGPDADRVFAFSRGHDDARLLVAVTRFPTRGIPDAELPLPAGCRDLLTDRIVCEGAAPFADISACVMVT
jgi:(1->4)-alpha-D-glucan 1-alpha-D-glucosylmutase